MTSTYSSQSMSISSQRSGSAAQSLKMSELVSGTSYASSLSPFGQSATQIKEVREREKKDLIELNDRLASYIEKVRFLEAQNRLLAHELETLQGRWNSGSVRTMYESQIQTSKASMSEQMGTRNELDREMSHLSCELDEWKHKLAEATASREDGLGQGESLIDKIVEIESQINRYKRRSDLLQAEITRKRTANQKIVSEINKFKALLVEESSKRAGFQSQVENLLQEVKDTSYKHNQELEELVVIAHKDSTPDNREYFKKELMTAIREIRVDYDKISAMARVDMESWYRKKVEEIQISFKHSAEQQTTQREEMSRLRVKLNEMRRKLADLEGRNILLEKQIQELNFTLEDDHAAYVAALSDRDMHVRSMREECEVLMVQLRELIHGNTNLDAEIAVYRKLLDGEENRAGLRELVEQVKTNYMGASNGKVVKSVKTTTVTSTVRSSASTASASASSAR